MNKCDKCGKETSELYPHVVRLPENPDVSVEDPSEIPIKTTEMQICSKCLNEYEAQLTKMDIKMRGHRVKMSRKWFEEKGDIEDLK